MSEQQVIHVDAIVKMFELSGLKLKHARHFVVDSVTRGDIRQEFPLSVTLIPGELTWEQAFGKALKRRKVNIQQLSQDESLDVSLRDVLSRIK